MYGMQSRFSREGYSKLRSQGIDFEIHAQIPVAAAAGISIDPKINISWTNEQNELWNKTNRDKKVYAFGAPPPAYSDADRWQKLVITVKITTVHR